MSVIKKIYVELGKYKTSKDACIGLARKEYKMALTINTNISSIVAQRNLNSATTSLNTAIERMTTGYKINHASDNAAGYSIAKNWETQLSSLDVAADNAATGSDMLSTLEDTYALVNTHLQRVRDLTEQAANGTYGEDSLKAIQSEITARLEEVDRIAANCEFNGLNMMDGSMGTINLQVGLDSSDNSKIELSSDLFAKGDIKSLFGTEKATLAKQCAGLDDTKSAADMLDSIDNVINTISSRVTTLGAAQNRIDSAIESIGVQSENITSSLSTLRDADIAEESSSYIQAQILQQAAATLLSTANQTPSIALNLI
jgi:flagellin